VTDVDLENVSDYLRSEKEVELLKKSTVYAEVVAEENRNYYYFYFIVVV
jgi:hypothetical protein